MPQKSRAQSFMQTLLQKPNAGRAFSRILTDPAIISEIAQTAEETNYKPPLKSLVANIPLLEANMLASGIVPVEEEKPVIIKTPKEKRKNLFYFSLKDLTPLGPTPEKISLAPWEGNNYREIRLRKAGLQPKRVAKEQSDSVKTVYHLANETKGEPVLVTLNQLRASGSNATNHTLVSLLSKDIIKSPDEIGIKPRKRRVEVTSDNWKLLGLPTNPFSEGEVFVYEENGARLTSSELKALGSPLSKLYLSQLLGKPEYHSKRRILEREGLVTLENIERLGISKEVFNLAMHWRQPQTQGLFCLAKAMNKTYVAEKEKKEPKSARDKKKKILFLSPSEFVPLTELSQSEKLMPPAVLKYREIRLRKGRTPGEKKGISRAIEYALGSKEMPELSSPNNRLISLSQAIEAGSKLSMAQLKARANGVGYLSARVKLKWHPIKKKFSRERAVYVELSPDNWGFVFNAYPEAILGKSTDKDQRVFLSDVNSSLSEEKQKSNGSLLSWVKTRSELFKPEKEGSRWTILLSKGNYRVIGLEEFPLQEKAKQTLEDKLETNPNTEGILMNGRMLVEAGTSLSKNVALAGKKLKQFKQYEQGRLGNSLAVKVNLGNCRDLGLLPENYLKYLKDRGYNFTAEPVIPAAPKITEDTPKDGRIHVPRASRYDPDSEPTKRASREPGYQLREGEDVRIIHFGEHGERLHLKSKYPISTAIGLLQRSHPAIYTPEIAKKALANFGAEGKEEVSGEVLVKTLLELHGEKGENRPLMVDAKATVMRLATFAQISEQQALLGIQNPTIREAYFTTNPRIFGNRAFIRDGKVSELVEQLKLKYKKDSAQPVQRRASAVQLPPAVSDDQLTRTNRFSSYHSSLAQQQLLPSARVYETLVEKGALPKSSDSVPQMDQKYREYTDRFNGFVFHNFADLKVAVGMDNEQLAGYLASFTPTKERSFNDPLVLNVAYELGIKNLPATDPDIYVCKRGALGLLRTRIAAAHKHHKSLAPKT